MAYEQKIPCLVADYEVETKWKIDFFCAAAWNERNMCEKP